jgi:ABC-type amino acid transport substrate-binding protein
VPPGPMPSTSLVVSGQADIVSQLNATGGDTQGMRRRTSRRFTCTMSAISQYIHIPAKSQLAKEINTVDDLSKRKGLRICTGPLATQTTRAFFPQHTVSTKYLNDLTGCDKDIQAGKADLIVNPLPALSIGGLKGYKSVHTLIVAGTPIWVAREDVQCADDGNPRTEDQCSRIE